MDPTQFAYWLQGFAELNDAPPTPEQWQSIKEHLSLVFLKVTPPVRVPADYVVQPKTDWVGPTSAPATSPPMDWQTRVIC